MGADLHQKNQNSKIWSFAQVFVAKLSHPTCAWILQCSAKPLTLRLVVQAWLAPIYLDENRPALQKPLEKAVRAAFNYGRVILTCQGHPDNCQDVTAGVRYSLTGAHKMNQNQHKRATNNTTTLQKSTILLKLQARLKLQDRHYQHYTTD